MDITDLIGNGKLLEPPFKIVESLISGALCLMDSKHKVILTEFKSEINTVFFNHICDLLNKEYLRKDGEHS